MSKHKLISALGAAAVIIAGAGLLSAFGIGGGKEHEVSYAARGSIAGSIEESGDIEGEHEYTYFARVSAPVKWVDMKVGDVVSAGDKLLIYDTEDFERSVSEAGISREQSEENVKGQIDRSNEYSAKFSKAVAEDEAYAVLYALEREYGNSIDEGQYSDNWNTSRTSDSINISIAGKNKEVAEKQREQAELDEDDEDYKHDYDELNEDIAELNEDIAGLREQLASLPPTELTPEEYEKANDTKNWMDDITWNWTQSRTQRNNYETAILNESQKEALEKQTDLAKSKEEAAIYELSKAESGVDAEFGGVVTECNVKFGNVVSEGTPLFKIVGSDDLKVTVMISKYDIGQIKTGQRAEIEISGMTYTGEVSRINHVATSEDSDKTKVAVEVHIDEVDENLILGLEADVTIYTDEQEDVLLIPYSGFYSDDGGDYCYVIEDGIIVKKYVTAGIKTSEFVEIKDGLKEGDAVITDSITDSQVGEKAVGTVH
ncbi:MAG: efflux RND transporter periplasmic adaptor subunit [Lachnospiraceae bacterium]|nr:efflux RND transporter periplasmic adaptor subunit [Lachnospiraceae bacterium]